ncbi:MAG: DJ-1/PfpI family protein [Blastocatellia bacterium]|nr:DJ-1/PfpI family protein [Blastocatellia bacterium]
MKSTLVFLAQGFEEMEAIIVIDVLRRAGVTVTTVATGLERLVTGSHNLTLLADKLLSELHQPASNHFDLVVLPGGQPGTNHLRDHPQVKAWVTHQAQAGKLVAAICAAPLALAAAGLLPGKTFTSHPSVRASLQSQPDSTYLEQRVVVDGNLITSRSPGTAFEFALILTELLAGKEKASELAEAMLVQIN